LTASATATAFPLSRAQPAHFRKHRDESRKQSDCLLVGLFVKDSEDSNDIENRSTFHR
jgi:hypothetical protein